MLFGDLDGKEIQKKREYMYTYSDSLCCTVETSTTLESKYTSLNYIQTFFFKFKALWWGGLIISNRHRGVSDTEGIPGWLQRGWQKARKAGGSQITRCELLGWEVWFWNFPFSPHFVLVNVHRLLLYLGRKENQFYEKLGGTNISARIG